MARCITAAAAAADDAGATSSGATPKFGALRDANDFSASTVPTETAIRLTNAASTAGGNGNGHTESKLSHYGNNLIKANLNNSGDLASVDSSDTYASCQTHPFLSQGDLTGEMADITCTLAEFDVDDLYFTSLEKDRPSTSIDMKSKSQVKKSASGDASLLSLGACAPMEEVLVIFEPPNPTPKTNHRHFSFSKLTSHIHFTFRKRFNRSIWHPGLTVAVTLV